MRRMSISRAHRSGAGPEAASSDPSPHDIPIALKSSLVDSGGVPYREFRRTLTPRYGRVWLQIGAGYAVLVLVPAALVLWAPGSVPLALVGAIAVGYTLAYLNNFFHEAAHHNLLPRRRHNDLAANLLMGCLFGSSIEIYRRIHFQHHRALGTTEDSENSYFDALRIRYLLQGLLGLKVLRTMRRYRAIEATRRLGAAGGKPTAGARVAWMAIAALANLGIAVALWMLGSLPAAGAWLGGLLLVFPFFVSLRQLLEHRSDDADPAVDYSAVDHGAVNRLFGDGPLASTLGSAGFNRHALHHWEPTVSYTRLKDIERYLLRTPLRQRVEARRTTYADTFLRLLVP